MGEHTHSPGPLSRCAASPRHSHCHALRSPLLQAQLSCKFSPELGVGDVPGSFGYDGHRRKKWNVSSKDYGVDWSKGDTVTVTLDCSTSTAEYYRNGVSMGPAYTDVLFGPDVAYFPAASLSDTEALRFNFGAVPLKYPVAGFTPLMSETRVAAHALAATVLRALRDVVTLADEGVIAGDDYVCVSARLWEALVQLLDEYSVAAQLIPWLHTLVSQSNRLRMVLESLVMGCERAETAWLVAQLCSLLSQQCVSHELHVPAPPLELFVRLLEISPYVTASASAVFRSRSLTPPLLQRVSCRILGVATPGRRAGRRAMCKVAYRRRLDIVDAAAGAVLEEALRTH